MASRVYRPFGPLRARPRISSMSTDLGDSGAALLSFVMALKPAHSTRDLCRKFALCLIEEAALLLQIFHQRMLAI